ncbi:MAG: hypothetical protein LRY41_02035 [Candidatus Pacebacteria bacterium]|nr:hypothetical protein [Candidatus Paceibacterota bacterium]MCD8508095.1 hypothetical protein [Candidatus Paceibacterota bacterium]MCD8528087.1 hypothetical protein [Candidatus Paceibacterota bacterium]MCD8563730.1 hypothetical protein [Candidatus Paceibacterota bacterium]
MKNLSPKIILLIIIALIAGIILVRSNQSVDIENNTSTDQEVDEVYPLASCVTITSPQAGAEVILPLTISGTFTDIGCWKIFEGEAGFVTLEQAGAIIAGGTVDQGLITVSGDFYDQASYPLAFSATITELATPATGPIDMVLTERADLGEDGMMYIPQVVVMPIILE